ALGSGQASQSLEGDGASYARILGLVQFRSRESDGEQEKDVILGQRRIAVQIDFEILRRTVGAHHDAPISRNGSATAWCCAGLLIALRRALICVAPILRHSAH